MNGKVRFVVTATCWNFIDQWYYDTIEKAREKFSEILVIYTHASMDSKREAIKIISKGLKLLD